MLGLGKDEVILYIVFSSILDALYRVFSNCSPLRVLSVGFRSKSHKSVEISILSCNIERYLLRCTNGTLYCGFGWRTRQLGQFPSLETWR